MKDFWEKFNLKNDVTDEVKLIIGEQPYKQSFGSKDLKVSISNSNIKLYNDLGNIAFVVTDWIKIQDSLEMIFNLLFGHQQSISVIGYLKTHSITPINFAESLWDNAKILLVNRYINGSDKREIIESYIKSLEYNSINILFVGNEGEFDLEIKGKCINTAIAIHPSGVNLNFDSRLSRYNDNWFYCKGEKLNKRSDNFRYDSFRILTSE